MRKLFVVPILLSISLSSIAFAVSGSITIRCRLTDPVMKGTASFPDPSDCKDFVWSVRTVWCTKPAVLRFNGTTIASSPGSASQPGYDYSPNPYLPETLTRYYLGVDPGHIPIKKGTERDEAVAVQNYEGRNKFLCSNFGEPLISECADYTFPVGNKTIGLNSLIMRMETSENGQITGGYFENQNGVCRFSFKSN